VSRIIGLYSPAPQSGKTFTATVLAQKGFMLMSFAEPIKHMAVKFFTFMGYPKDEALKLVWTQKEKHIPEIKTTVRRVLQTLGTEWGRDCIDQNIWVDCMMHRIYAYSKRKPGNIVIDDVRFLNEAEIIKKLNGEVWKIVRPVANHDGSHQSEGALDNWNQFDQVIENDGTLHDFRMKIDSLLQ
jgi:hypothetical protein